ncbi:MAG: hypothetical protein LBV04_06085, partial [Deferribacteraceae bacterium]|nr:hypothetical protein [Deferribacteraceae bacterium]
MDKESIVRTIIAIGLCLVFFVVWNMFFVKPTPAPDTGIATQSPQDGTSPEGVTAIAPPVAATVTAEPPIVLQTKDYEIAFDSSTGDIRYVSLNAFKGED